MSSGAHQQCIFRFACVQLLVGEHKQENLNRARQKIREAVALGAEVVALPECFNCPYSNASFPVYAEPVPDGSTTRMLQKEAQRAQIYLIGGSFPESEGEGASRKLYNTCLVIGPDGSVIAKHRKLHLFDVDIPGKITFKESQTLSSGNSFTMFTAKLGPQRVIECTFGIGICYDIRFPELALVYRSYGAKFLVYPGAFNTTTGPLHWELLQRARAIDNQVFVAAVSPARCATSTYQAWGHSTVVSPWGKILATTEEHEAIVIADIDLALVDEMRSQIPVGMQKRNDMYEVKAVTSSGLL